MRTPTAVRPLFSLARVRTISIRTIAARPNSTITMYLKKFQDFAWFYPLFEACKISFGSVSIALINANRLYDDRPLRKDEYDVALCVQVGEMTEFKLTQFLQVLHKAGLYIESDSDYKEGKEGFIGVRLPG
jgi:hypothetical protein